MLKIERILWKYEGSFLLKIFSNISESIFSMVSDLYFCFWSWLPFLKTGATCWKLVLMRMDIRMAQLKMPRSTLQKKSVILTVVLVTCVGFFYLSFLIWHKFPSYDVQRKILISNYLAYAVKLECLKYFQFSLKDLLQTILEWPSLLAYRKTNNTKKAKKKSKIDQKIFTIWSIWQLLYIYFFFYFSCFSNLNELYGFLHYIILLNKWKQAFNCFRKTFYLACVWQGSENVSAKSLSTFYEIFFYT